jgi:hypothetical protein
VERHIAPVLPANGLCRARGRSIRFPSLDYPFSELKISNRLIQACRTEWDARAIARCTPSQLHELSADREGVP